MAQTSAINMAIRSAIKYHKTNWQQHQPIQKITLNGLTSAKNIIICSIISKGNQHCDTILCWKLI